MMRTLLPAILACIAVASAMGGWMIAAASAPAGAPPKPPAPASIPSPAAQRPASPSASPIDNDAPARHARRTACLKDAKTKKLVGAQRNAYVKGCVGPH